LPSPDEFAFSSAPEPHRNRTKEILRRHPEVRQLIGTNPVTLWWTVALVAFQLALAALVPRFSWWLVVAMAFCIGAFANHALFVVIHECAHKLVFRRKLPNILTAMFANLPLFVPGALSFQKYHLKHHAFQGIYELDADLPSRWEARLIGHSVVGKTLWLMLYPIFQALRPLRIREVPLFDRWTTANLLIQVGFNVAVYLVLGPKALVYLALSLFFSIGLHPLGARWIQRHYVTTEGDQETFSYYGFLNALTFNVGYHNEHHDFPSVPWNNLPRVRATAPEAYQDLSYHRSWTRLLFRFLFDPTLSLWSRVIRRNRNDIELDTPVTPDQQLISLESAVEPAAVPGAT
jgi:sphingolipid delta-4 desaturase